MGMESKFIWSDGKLVEYEKATVHMLTGALHYGAAVFEGIRAYATDRGPEVVGLSEIDFRRIGEGKTGRITREIQNAYHDAGRGRIAKFESWCDYVL